MQIASFRRVCTDRRYNPQTGSWEDGNTSWFPVSAFRGLAEERAGMSQEGERLIITGSLCIRDWEAADKTGTDVKIEADAIGHDLTCGTSQFVKNPRENVDAPRGSETASPAAETATA